MDNRSHAAISRSSLVAKPDDWSDAALADSTLGAKVVLDLCNSTSAYVLPPWLRWKVRKPRFQLFCGTSSQTGVPPPPPATLVNCTDQEYSNGTAAGYKAINATRIGGTSSKRLHKKTKEEKLFKQKNNMKRTVSWVIGNLKKSQPAGGDKGLKFKIKDQHPGTPDRTS